MMTGGGAWGPEAHPERKVSEPHRMRQQHTTGTVPTAVRWGGREVPEGTRVLQGACTPGSPCTYRGEWFVLQQRRSQRAAVPMPELSSWPRRPRAPGCGLEGGYVETEVAMLIVPVPVTVSTRARPHDLIEHHLLCKTSGIQRFWGFGLQRRPRGGRGRDSARNVWGSVPPTNHSQESVSGFAPGGQTHPPSSPPLALPRDRAGCTSGRGDGSPTPAVCRAFEDLKKWLCSHTTP